ncbi:MAG TPA: hypothetical protein PKZ74_11800 [Bacteroidales bacterium]|nr:hypothetical protein [Bacteroidales bacterium]
MKKNYFIWIGLIMTVLFLSGCLTCEKKEYTFQFTGKDSGRLTIKYINILSTMDDTIDVSEEDFASLMTDYIEGSEIENEFPDATVVDKRLFEENGVLCGEIVLEFSNLTACHLYQHKGKGPIMYCLGCYSIDSEYYGSSNGEYGNDIMPVVFWEDGLKTLTLTTDVTTPDETTVSLLDRWKLGY